MIFPILFADKVVQTGELIRFDASDSKGNIKSAKITIEGVETDFSPSDIAKGKMFQDWVFETTGEKTIRLDMVEDNEDLSASYKEIKVNVLASGDEKLFNTDADLLAYESKIRSWIPDGRSTWNFVHREVKRVILEELSSKFGDRVDEDNILSTLQFREWAKFKALEMIFRGINNTESDVFSSKAEFYGKESMNYRTLAFNHIELDIDGDGEISEETEKVSLNKVIMVVR